MALPPPASDMKIAFCPPGDTSSMSMSAGNVWLSPVMVTLTSVIAPVTPETTQVDGYGVAGPASLIVIAPPLQPGGGGAEAAEVAEAAEAAEVAGAAAEAEAEAEAVVGRRRSRSATSS